MQVRLLVERDQNECVVKLAGTAYKFERNEHGHLVSEITDQEHIKWVSDPNHNTAFKAYSAPKKKIVEMVDEMVTVGPNVEALPVHEHVGKNSYAPHYGQVDETELPPYPQKGSKKPKKEQG